MPLYMDLHRASDFDVPPTLEDLKRHHVADVAIQNKYGVKFIQYWVNEVDGFVYCMVEAPDKESCLANHREAHGFVACNIIELEGGDYQTFMGDEVKKNKFDLVETPEGNLDTGHRILIAVEPIGINKNDKFTSLQDHHLQNKLIRKIIKNFQGREVDSSVERIMAVFNSGSMALECAVNILSELQKTENISSEIRIGISAGGPVTERSDFFGYTIQLANRLCNIAQNNEILISPLAKRLIGTFESNEPGNKFKVISPQDEKFLNNFFDNIEKVIGKEDFNLENFGKSIGISRAQLYRKVVLLTGQSPGNFLNELRLKKALKLVKQNFGNISEIAFEAGFNNLSYFSKSFQKRFGLLPSHYLSSLSKESFL